MSTSTDDKIAQALDDDDRAFLDSLEEDRGMFRQIGDSMHGALGGWAKLIFAISFLLGVALLYSVWQLFAVETVRETILWATATLAILTAQGFAKGWFFERMNMLNVLREVKRLQVQVALLQEDR